MTFIIDIMADRISELRKKHEKHMLLSLQRHFPLHGIRDKLLKKERLEADQITGDVFFHLLNDIENQR